MTENTTLTKFTPGFNITPRYTEEEVKFAAEEYFGDAFSADVWMRKYVLKSNENVDAPYCELTPSDMHDRLATEIYRIESQYKNPLSYETFRESMEGFSKIVPQGSPMFGIGNPFVNISISNCVVVESPKDSISSIFDTGKELANLFKRRCGVGVSIDTLRPEGSLVNNAAKSSTGAWSFSSLYSEITRKIGQGGRRGALMVTMSIKHPDVHKFTFMKQDLSQTTGANISIMLDDDFMRSTEAKSDWITRWPIEMTDEEVQAKIDLGGEWVKEEKSTNNPIESYVWVSEIADRDFFLRKFDADGLWQFVNECARNTAEPGILFWDNYFRNLPANYYDGFKSVSTNPCLTGETKIFVADGRGAVPIKVLSDEGKDIPVFCVDKDGAMTMRTMRAPRCTAKDQTILKITFDDGGSLRCTENHRILLSNGKFVEAKNLVSGMSVRPFTRYQRSTKYNVDKKPSTKYWHWASGFRNAKTEHRIVAESVFGPIPQDHVVHHKNYDSLDNALSNLEIMSTKSHDTLHGESRRGEDNPFRKAYLNQWTDDRRESYKKLQQSLSNGQSNPMFSGFTNEQITSHMKDLILSIGRRPSSDEWIAFASKNGLPKSFSNYRKCTLGDVTTLSKKLCIDLGIEFSEEDPRVVKTYRDLLDKGYSARIVDGACFVDKTCDQCSTPFTVEAQRSHANLCSRRCAAMKASSTIGRLETSIATRKKKSVANAQGQVQIFLDLKWDLGREPRIAEWETVCKKLGLPSRLGKTSGTFESYKALKEEALVTNHKVVSVVVDGTEDVYSGTVDEFTNYLSCINTDGEKETYVCQLNCSEISLSPYDSCRLTSLNLKGFVVNPFQKDAYFDFKDFEKFVRIGMHVMDNIVDLEIECIQKMIAIANEQDEKDLWTKMLRAASDGRRTGLGTHALADCLAALGIKYDTDEALEMVEKIYRMLRDASYDESVNLAIERGAFAVFDWERDRQCEFIQRLPAELQDRIAKHGRRNISLLTNAPTGSVAIVSKTSSGIEPTFRFMYTRRTKINPNDDGMRVDYKDSTGDCWMHFPIFEHNLKQYLSLHPDTQSEWDEIQKNVHGNTPDKTDELRYDALMKIVPDYFVDANNIDPLQRVRLQGVLQAFIDHGVSSTINLPEDVTADTVRHIYEEAWKAGLKGVTVYRDKCRSGVLITGSQTDKKTNDIVESHAPKRPETLECDIHRSNIAGQQWIILVGRMESGKLYEIFGGKAESVDIPKKYTNGLVKKRRCEKPNAKGRLNCYDLSLDDPSDPLIIRDIAVAFSDGDYGIQTRMISQMLRHGIHPKFVAEQLSRDTESSIVSFNKVMARILRKYVRDEDGDDFNAVADFCKSGSCE